MKRLVQILQARPIPKTAATARIKSCFVGMAVACAFAGLFAAASASAQIIIDSKTGAVRNEETGAQVDVDRRYQQITPTKVSLTKSELDPKTRLELIRLLQSEQGFAMRPLPRGHKGLTLVANGKLEPAGEAYLNMVTSAGMSAKPGDRVVLTDIKFDKSKIVFDLNGGPDPKHRFLRHVEIGAGPGMTGPVVQGQNDQEPIGSRLTLAFANHVPELTGADVKALLSPLISFDVKTPIQAFTDTLPKKLKDAILDHHVMVGMSTDMVLFAKGQPDGKSREMDGQMPFEEWIYGRPPHEVDFVRINGNRVIRVEVAKMGQEPQIFTRDEVEGLMRTDGTSLDGGNTRTVAEGDVERDPNRQSAAAPPTLRNPGEKLPTDNENTQVMRPVQFPKPRPDDENGGQPAGTQTNTAQTSGQGTGQGTSSTAKAGTTSSSTAPGSAPSATTPATAQPSSAPNSAPTSPPTKPEPFLPSER